MLVLFWALAYGLSWAAWAPLALGRPAASPYLHLLGGMGPAVAAVVVSAIQGRGALRRLLARLRPSGWLIIGGLAPLLLFALVALVLLVIGVGVDLGALGRSNEYPALGPAAHVASSLVCYGLGEELGWRGFLLPRLQARRSAAMASLMVAGIWCLWHLPLFVFSAGMASMGLLAIMGWAASMVSGSLLMTCLFNWSGGSVLAVAAFHGMLDVVMTSPAGSGMQSALGALVTVLGLTLPFRFGREQLAPRPRVIDHS